MGNLNGKYSPENSELEFLKLAYKQLQSGYRSYKLYLYFVATLRILIILSVWIFVAISYHQTHFIIIGVYLIALYITAEILYALRKISEANHVLYKEIPYNDQR